MARTPGSGPVERPQEQKPAPRRPLQRVRALGVLAAWVGGVACGWNVALQADLLSAVFRGAAAWLGFIVVWMVGASVCERLVSSPRSAADPGAPGSHDQESATGLSV